MLVLGLCTVGREKHEKQGEAGLKVTYDIRSKKLKQSEEENRILRKLLSNKEIELEVQRELLKKNRDVRSKKDLIDAIFIKNKISKTKIINMVGMIHSSYYHVPSLGRKVHKPSFYTYHQAKELVTQETVIDSVKRILEHEFIDCEYRLMCSYLKKYGYLLINHKKLYRIMKEEGLLK